MPIEPIVSTEDGDSGTLNVRIGGRAWCWTRIARIILGRVCERLGGGLKGRGAFRVEFESEIFSVEDGEVLGSLIRSSWRIRSQSWDSMVDNVQPREETIRSRYRCES